MKRNVLFAIWLCMSCMGLLACGPAQASLPIDLLGKDFSEIKGQFVEINLNDDTDYHEFDGKVRAGW